MNKKTLIFGVSLLVSHAAMGQPIYCPQTVDCTKTPCTMLTVQSDADELTNYWTPDFADGKTHKFVRAEGMTPAGENTPTPNRCVYDTTDSSLTVTANSNSKQMPDVSVTNWTLWDWAGTYFCNSDTATNCPYTTTPSTVKKK